MDGKRLRLRPRACSSVPEVITMSSPKGNSDSHDLSSFQRQQRNLAEKQRRDRFNGYIQELSTLVPMVSKAARRLDKISVLRLAAAHLRIHCSSLNPKCFKKIQSLPDFVKKNVPKIQAALGGFLMIVSCSGKIIFTSSDVESYIGHQDIDMMGHSLYSYIQPSDIALVQEEMDDLVDHSRKDSASESRATFCANLREHSQPRSDTVTYRTMQFHCSLSCDSLSKTEEQQTLTSHRTALDSISLIKMFVSPIDINPLNELSLSEAFQDEYVTTHGLKGEILYADHRISTITGHLPNEVRGMSAYQYIFSQDVPVALFAQKLMFSSNSGTGIIVYRLRTRSDNFVYLQSTGFLEYKSSTEISHFVCYNKLLSDEEGSKELKKFQERFVPLSTETSQSIDEEHQRDINSDSTSPSLPQQSQDVLQPTGYAVAQESLHCCSGEVNAKHDNSSGNHCVTNDILKGFGARNSLEASEIRQSQVLQQSSPELKMILSPHLFQVNHVSNAVLINYVNPIIADDEGAKRKYEAAFGKSTSRQPVTTENHLNTKKCCQLNGIHCMNEHSLYITDALVSEQKSNSPDLIMCEPSPNSSTISIQDPFETLFTQSADSVYPDVYSNTVLDSTEVHGQNYSAQNGSAASPVLGALPSNCDFDPFIDELSYAVDENYHTCSKNFLS